MASEPVAVHALARVFDVLWAAGRLFSEGVSVAHVNEP